jgi:hypothetical protein
MVGPVMGGGSGAETTFSGRWINLSRKNVCLIALGLSEERQELAMAQVIARTGECVELSKAKACAGPTPSAMSWRAIAALPCSIL